MSLKLTGLALLLTFTATAQFEELAVTDDGRLYFWTTHRLRGQPQDNESKIIRMTGAGFEIVAAAPARGGVIPPSLRTPFVSGDGNTYGYNEDSGCGSPSCGLSGLPRNTIRLNGARFPGGVNPQSGHISRNGRFFVGTKWPNGLLWIDLETGRVEEPAASRPASRNGAIANDGTALVFIDTPQSSGGLALYHPDRGLTPLDVQAVFSATISPDAQSIVIERVGDRTLELGIRVPSGINAFRVLATMPYNSRNSPYLTVFHPTFANDGRLLYLSPIGPASLLQLAVFAQGRTTLMRPVPEGVRSAIIAGAGHTGYAITNLHRLLRLHPLTLDHDELLPPTPRLGSIVGAAPPGSAVRGLASGVTRDTEVYIGDLRAPVTHVDPRFAFFQVPWEALPVQRAPMIVRMQNNPFEWHSVFTVDATPSVRIDRESYIEGLEFIEIPQIYHQDFRGVLTREDPARPGETIHLFATNLGPVDHPQHTGEPAPPSPFARITTPFACYLRERPSEARVEGAVLPFVGLTPGSTGIYQIDLTIPTNWTGAFNSIECVNSFGSRDAVSVTVRP